MSPQELRALQEAYLSVYELDEATAMAKRGKDETEIRNQIASKTRGGEFADKAGKLADRETYGNKEMKAGREKLARKQRGDFRDTNSSSPGLRGYGHQSSDPAVKAKQDARGNQRARAALTPNERKQLNMEFDLYDVILAHLLAEGYADTNENALVIMANMSEGWKDNILEARVDDSLSDEEKQDARNKRSGGQSDFTRRNLTKAGRGKSPKGLKPVETTPAMTSVRKFEMSLNQPRTSVGKRVRGEIEMNKAERGPSGRRGS